MNIQYRIVKVDPESHGVVIRYFTDKLTEMDLASSFNEDGSVNYNSHPLDFRRQPLQKTATDILGLDYKEVKPKIKVRDLKLDNSLNCTSNWSIKLKL